MFILLLFFLLSLSLRIRIKGRDVSNTQSLLLKEYVQGKEVSSQSFPVTGRSFQEEASKEEVNGKLVVNEDNKETVLVINYPPPLLESKSYEVLLNGEEKVSLRVQGDELIGK